MAKNQSKRTSASEESRRKTEAAEAARKKESSKRLWTAIGIAAVVVTAAIVIYIVWQNNRDLNQMVDLTYQEQAEEGPTDPGEAVGDTGNLIDPGSGNEDEQPVTENTDLRIPVDRLSENPTFFRAIVDGVSMDVIACKLPDGSIRTAFNTSEICQNSGKGYYIVDGDDLVCQNCGVHIPIKELGLERDGCHPIPIPESARILNETEVVIPFTLLRDNKRRFTNWGRI